MLALVDCNNFFVSCERIFEPKFEKLPVAVLSSNDGCIIARSNEVKQLGIQMGAPYFKYRDLFLQHDIKIFSSNFNLYSDISSRVMSVLEEFCPNLEIYSVDEAFLELESVEEAEKLRRIIRRWIGIPVSIGIAPTKTLAKLASKIAKKTGVYAFDDPDPILKKLPVDAIWGVGRRWSKKLNGCGIHTALDFKNADPLWIKKKLSVIGERMVYELNGTPCLTLETAPQNRQSLVVSRSFGEDLSELPELQEALTHHVARACEKLRSENLHAKHLTVFLHGREISAQLPAMLPYYTNHTTHILNAAVESLGKIFKPCQRYTKVGIQLCDFTENAPQDLFATYDYEKMEDFSTTLDAINQKYGKNVLKPARALGQGKWRVQSGHQSQQFTTNWQELLLVKTD